MDREDRIFNSLDKIESRLDSIDQTLVKHDVNLQEHMKRSLANEEAVDLIVKELKPVKEHVLIMKFIGKVITYILGSTILLFILEKLFLK